MPDGDHDPFAPDPKSAGAPVDSPARRSSRRRKSVIGVTGLAAVLGVAAFVVTDRLTDDSSTRDVGAISAPQRTASMAPAGPRSAVGRPATSAFPSASSAMASTTGSKPDAQVSREIIAARSRAAADGVPLRRGLTSKALNSVPDVQVTTSGSPHDPGGTMKVVSARGDLTDYQEMSWVGDKGQPIGDVNCTQNFRLSNDVKPTKRPSLLVCWRTSANKSVYTVALDIKGKPSKQASVAAIEKAWAKLS